MSFFALPRSSATAHARPAGTAPRRRGSPCGPRGRSRPPRPAKMGARSVGGASLLTLSCLKQKKKFQFLNKAEFENVRNGTRMFVLYFIRSQEAERYKMVRLKIFGFGPKCLVLLYWLVFLLVASRGGQVCSLVLST